MSPFSAKSSSSTRLCRSKVVWWNPKSGMFYVNLELVVFLFVSANKSCMFDGAKPGNK